MNLAKAKARAKKTGQPVTYHSSWGDCEGQTTVTYLGHGFRHWWIPNDGTNSGAEIFSNSKEVERPSGVPECAAYFCEEGDVYEIDIYGFRCGWSEAEHYLSCDY